MNKSRYSRPHIYFNGEKWHVAYLPFDSLSVQRAWHFCRVMNEKRAMQYFTGR